MYFETISSKSTYVLLAKPAQMTYYAVGSYGVWFVQLVGIFEWFVYLSGYVLWNHFVKVHLRAVSQTRADGIFNGMVVQIFR